ncbi:hypothetical protein U9M48_000273 [Paspalum notatum var. saurae]|uniref:Uncharacterized protein n=1 Tax=Paspalum notatum var. saurae TaxID=547442 RepID=A0AAQ3SCB1_PASNO
MAAVLDAFAPYVKKLIADMAQEEVSMLLGVSGEITKLEDNMEGLKVFLADAERRRLTDQSVQRWVRKLKGAMYDATDILDLCHLEADKRKESSRGHMPNCLQPLLFCVRNPVFAHKIGSSIKELNRRLEGIHKAARDFSFNINLTSFPDQMMLTATSYQARSQIDESAIVGEQIERDTKELVQVLTTASLDGDDEHNRYQIKVVSIVGTGGMGKTTLTQKIFNEATIQEHFKTKIWLSITKHFDDVELLRTAIKHANSGGDHGLGHGEHQDKSTLTDTLTHTLASSGRFLLVLDDVWSKRAWDNVLGVPVRNASRSQPGSRVVVTTRSAHLPQQMQAPLHEHRVRPLHQDDAWSLLKKQLQPDQVVGIDEQLKNIGMEILSKCDGLPLAVKVVGGLLSTKYPSEHEWKAVLNKPAWSLDGLPTELDSRLHLSYEDLTPQLRQCFLYCSLIPKGKVIMRGVVTPMWVSEGFIQSPAGSHLHEYELEDKANDYYTELSKRNLIEPTIKYSITGQGCTMHDVVRSFAEYMAREESLVVVDKEQLAATGARGGGMLVRRLSIAQTVPVGDGEWAILRRQESLRTLIMTSGPNFKPSDSFGHFSSLRVLLISSAAGLGDRLVSSLSKLKHLRHLYLEDTDISRLPDDIHKMKFIQYIDLLNCEKLRHLPISTIKLMHLRSLDITGSINISTVPKGIGGLTNLRTFLGFPVHVSMDTAGNAWCSLQELAPLSQLRELAIDGVEKVSASWMAEKAMIGTKSHLSYLVLNYNSTGERTAGPHSEAEHQQQPSVMMEEVLEKLRPPTCLERFGMKGGYVGRQLPNWMRAPAASADFKSLRYLQLVNLLCCTQLPDGLCRLPSLEGLIIKDAPSIKRVGNEFQAPSSAAGASTAALAPFPKLKILQLGGLPKWEEWEWNDFEEQRGIKATNGMPCLKELLIENCKLSRLPPGLASIKRLALRDLSLYTLTNITALENFPSVVELYVFDCPELKMISNLSKLQKIRIGRCPNLLVLEGVPALDSMMLEDGGMEALPEYLAAVNPRLLVVAYTQNLRYQTDAKPRYVKLEVLERSVAGKKAS